MSEMMKKASRDDQRILVSLGQMKRFKDLKRAHNPSMALTDDTFLGILLSDYLQRKNEQFHRERKREEDRAREKAKAEKDKAKRDAEDAKKASGDFTESKPLVITDTPIDTPIEFVPDSADVE